MHWLLHAGLLLMIAQIGPKIAPLTVPGGSQGGPRRVTEGSWQAGGSWEGPEGVSEPSWGPSWSSLGALLGHYWAILTLPEPLLGPSWGHLGAVLARLGILGRLGAISGLL